jgi:hypothetical protein
MFPDAANQANISKRYETHLKEADLTGGAVGKIVGYEVVISFSSICCYV